MSKPIRLKPKDLNSIEISGFKSIAKKTKIDIAPLTIFSGANSSGKSSVSQAVLLLKQTNEAAYDPGALLLNGPNVKLTSATQLMSQLPGLSAEKFTIAFGFQDATSVELSYKTSPEKPGGVDINFISLNLNGEERIRVSSSSRQQILRDAFLSMSPKAFADFYDNLFGGNTFKIERNKCFYEIITQKVVDGKPRGQMSVNFGFPEDNKFLQALIHVPGLRGNPERTYSTTATSSGKFPGRFESYVASLVSDWERNDKEKFSRLAQNLSDLGLTSEIKTNKIDDTQVEIRVSRFKSPQLDPQDHFVSIADVGFGVSQVLPILVALNAATPGQYVIIEQPELHLHPKAQSKLAAVLADAMVRGVRLIIETHSNILLQGIQTLVALGEIHNESVALNWFETTDEGYTKVTRGKFDNIGAFGGWPADFMEIQIESESAYLDAVEKTIFGTQANEE